VVYRGPETGGAGTGKRGMMAINVRRGLFWAWLVFAVPWVGLWLGFFIFYPPPSPGWTWKLFMNSAGVLVVPPLGLLLLGRLVLWVVSASRRSG